MTETVDYYETLEVSSAASVEELKSAYLRLVRQFTPESAPERFRLVSEAYRILSNPERRREYDREERLPAAVREEMSALMERALDLEDEEAIDQLCDLCDDHPGSHILRFGLGTVLDRLDRHHESAEVFSGLFDADPGNAVYATWLGDSMLKAGDPARGVQLLKEAIVLDKDCSDAYVCLSRHYAEAGQDEEAIKVLERGINADGRVDAQDLPLFCQEILILAKGSQWKRLEDAAQRLVSAIPQGDITARQYAGSQLAPMVPLFANAERPDLLHYVVDLISKLDPQNTEARELADQIEGDASFYRSKCELYEDSGVPAWVKALVSVWSGDETPDDPEKFATGMIVHLVGRRDESLREWDLVRGRHPRALSPFQSQWSKMTTAMRAAGSRARTGSSAASGSGCTLLLLLGGATWFIAGGVL